MSDENVVYLVWWADKWGVDFGVHSVWSSFDEAEKQLPAARIRAGDNTGEPWVEKRTLNVIEEVWDVW